jgi:LuxR family transcriptional regulator, maltose regulon positive regulatory protein
MSWRTPLVEAGLLRESQNPETIAIDTPAWFAWLAEERHCSFHYVHPDGEFTARKERKQRGQWYWVAYRQVHGKLYKSYLGKSETITADHLAEAIGHLAEAEARSPSR